MVQGIRKLLNGGRGDRTTVTGPSIATGAEDMVLLLPVYPKTHLHIGL
jgi:hypothetical protein